MVTYDPLGVDYMCPFCVSPWKCNGPHIGPDDLDSFNSYVDDIRDEIIESAVKMIRENCGHTKYVGCRPCIHDQIAHRVEKLAFRVQST